MVLVLGKLSSPTTTIRSERRNHSRSPTSPPQLLGMKTTLMSSMMMKIKIQVKSSPHYVVISGHTKTATK